MSAPSPAPRFAAVIVAAGKGLRAGQAIPKQFAPWRGKPLLRHSVEALAAAGAAPIIVAIPQGGQAAARAAYVPVGKYFYKLFNSCRGFGWRDVLEGVRHLFDQLLQACQNPAIQHIFRIIDTI